MGVLHSAKEGLWDPVAATTITQGTIDTVFLPLFGSRCLSFTMGCHGYPLLKDTGDMFLGVETQWGCRYQVFYELVYCILYDICLQSTMCTAMGHGPWAAMGHGPWPMGHGPWAWLMAYGYEYCCYLVLNYNNIQSLVHAYNIDIVSTRGYLVF